MKKLLWLLMVPLAANAGSDYARQWPLQLETPDAGAYRVVLDETVYRQLQSPTLADLDVLDAQGRPVPTALIDPVVPEAPRARAVELPWFPLPAGRESSDIASISEIATDGSLRRVEWRTATSDGAAGGFLLDASQLDAPIHALRVQWTAGQAPFDLAVRVSASDDLRDWRTVADDAHLVELENAGRRVLRDRIELSPAKARYLRVMPLDPRARPLQVNAVTAELDAPAVALDWQWRTLQGTRVEAADKSVHYEFQLDGRFPVVLADISLPGNSSGEWRLQAREDASAPWRDVAPPWMAYRLEQSGQSEASPPQSLSGVHRDRLWRLTPRGGAGVTDVPQLRLGYRPEALVFVAQGAEPFALVAGSARAHRAEAPLGGMIDAMRAKRGMQWQPARATLHASTVLGGDEALAPAPRPRDWKTWLLWGLLVAGAVLVGGFAVSLLRRS
ncbi:DUF3999 domain-containing protein [Lysobacter panacisoli]|uniref:DUF3999 domain-containing protein n=1 Tax=Lysobacter panacisoli TaxID=1255263 RepID=A0ABP9LIH1_9GAMM|nr:DUF3999 domain-containing protein [Lysobacter panacisoli]